MEPHRSSNQLPRDRHQTSRFHPSLFMVLLSVYLRSVCRGGTTSDFLPGGEMRVEKAIEGSTLKLFTWVQIRWTRWKQEEGREEELKWNKQYNKGKQYQVFFGIWISYKIKLLLLSQVFKCIKIFNTCKRSHWLSFETSSDWVCDEHVSTHISTRAALTERHQRSFWVTSLVTRWM